MAGNRFRRQSPGQEAHGPAAVGPPGVMGNEKVKAGEAGRLYGGHWPAC